MKKTAQVRWELWEIPLVVSLDEIPGNFPLGASSGEFLLWRVGRRTLKAGEAVVRGGVSALFSASFARLARLLGWRRLPLGVNSTLREKEHIAETV